MNLYVHEIKTLHIAYSTVYEHFQTINVKHIIAKKCLVHLLRPLQVTFWFLVHRPHHIFWLKIPHYFYCACAVKRKEKRKKTKLIPHGEFLKLKLSKYLNVSIFFNQLKRKAYKFKLVSTTYIGYSFYRGVNSRLLCHVYDKLLRVQSVFKQNITSLENYFN